MISLMHCSIVLDEEDTPLSCENVKCDLDRFLLPFSLLDFLCPLLYLSLVVGMC